MLHFFRKIRYRLAKDNQFFKYSKYAIGEIVLVVIGILIALYINNKNEKRKENERFRLIIEQIYNEVDIERAWLVNNSLVVKRQIELIDSIILNPQEIPDEILPYAVFYVDLKLNLNWRLGNAYSMISTLDYNYDDVEQLEVAKQIRSFVDDYTWESDNIENVLQPLLNEAGIPTPDISLSYSEFYNFSHVNKMFFTPEEIDLLRSLLDSTRFRTSLKSLRSSRLRTLEIHLGISLRQANNLMEIVKSYSPDVRLLYKDIGVVGSAIDTGWDETVFMSRPDPNKSIWTIDLKLSDGFIKFRSSNSWVHNWGGKEFPSGDAIYYYQNIPVRKGYYRITLNLEDRTYNLEPIKS